MTPPRPDAGKISGMLAEQIEALCRMLLPAGRKEFGSWRVGRLDGARGSSLSIALNGSKRGLWHDHATGKGGDPLDLIEGALWLDTRQALAWARQWLGVERDTDVPSAPLRLAPDTTSGEETANQKPLWLWRRRQPVVGSFAETYLRRARGCGGPIPATLGFLPAQGGHRPALITAFGLCSEPEPGELSIPDANVKAVQLIKFNPDGSGKANVNPNKIIVGQGALGSPIVLAAPNDLLGLAVAEGIEDALSIHEATGLGAWASGGAGRLPALADSVPGYINFVTIIADRDPAGVNGAEGLAEGLRRRGIEHAVAFVDGGDRP